MSHVTEKTGGFDLLVLKKVSGFGILVFFLQSFFCVMVLFFILPQVLLRKPCYAFSFLLVRGFGHGTDCFRYTQYIFHVVLPAHPIRWSDGRCVQGAGTYSAQASDLCLQGTPRLRSKIPRIYPNHDADLMISLNIRTWLSHWMHHCSARAAQNI